MAEYTGKLILKEGTEQKILLPETKASQVVFSDNETLQEKVTAGSIGGGGKGIQPEYLYSGVTDSMSYPSSENQPITFVDIHSNPTNATQTSTFSIDEDALYTVHLHLNVTRDDDTPGNFTIKILRNEAVDSEFIETIYEFDRYLIMPNNNFEVTTFLELKKNDSLVFSCKSENESVLTTARLILMR